MPVWELSCHLSHWKQAAMGVLRRASWGPLGKNSRARVIAWGTLYLTVRLVEGKATRQYFYDVSIFRR